MFFVYYFTGLLGFFFLICRLHCFFYVATVYSQFGACLYTLIIMSYNTEYLFRFNQIYQYFSMTVYVFWVPLESPYYLQGHEDIPLYFL